MASVASMIDQFNMSNIRLLLSLGYQIDVAANFTVPGNISLERCNQLKEQLNSMGVTVYDIAIPRKFNIKNIRSANIKVKRLLEENKYDLIHCHSPFGGVIARHAAKKKRRDGLKVIYTAHGFHFYDGAPLKNWIAFYPVEKHYSRCTDVLITINSEDYNRALTKFHAGKTVKIPSVGVNNAKFNNCSVDSNTKRSELGLAPSDFVIISVGEMNANKNHQLIIRAIQNIPEAKYVLVGIGPLKDELVKLSSELGVSDRVKFLGYRTDINELLHMSDCFAFPSLREGLGLAALEALSSGVPVVASDIGGIRDYASSDTGILCKGHSVEEYTEALKVIMNTGKSHYSAKCQKKALEFDISVVDKIMTDVYQGCAGGLNEES